MNFNLKNNSTSSPEEGFQMTGKDIFRTWEVQHTDRKILNNKFEIPACDRQAKQYQITKIQVTKTKITLICLGFREFGFWYCLEFST